MKLFNLKELKEFVRGNPYESYICFCVGASLISRIIAAKTREYNSEIVPSHVLMIISNARSFVYESTSQDDKFGKKLVHGGVRRWLFEDWARCEKGKETLYILGNIDYIDDSALEGNIHRPYGMDSIVQFLVKDASKGSKKGLICSEYANLVLNALPDNPCPSPADLFRKYRDRVIDGLIEEE